ncbi:MAG: hypothetical protein Q9M35_08790 [Rhodothermus sp.]|nr:hypothetical protein [Rhodothermus sp.]
MNRLLHHLHTTKPARGSFWILLLAGLLLPGLTGCYTQLAATERVYYEEGETYERQPDRVIVERYDDDSTVVREYYYYDRPSYYYRRYFARFYGDPFFYYDCLDPFYYDPFYCDPFYYGPTFRFRLGFYFGDPFFFWPPFHHIHHGYYWFYGFGYYYSPYYWAYHPGHFYSRVYFFGLDRGRIARNYVPRGASVGRSAWMGRSPRSRRILRDRDDAYARPRSIVRTTRSTTVTPRGSSTGVERYSTQEATRTRARTMRRTRNTQVRGAERPRAVTGRSTITRRAPRSSERARPTVTRGAPHRVDKGRSRPTEKGRATVRRAPRNQGAGPHVQRTPSRRVPRQSARPPRRTRSRGGNNDRQELQYHRPGVERTYQVPSVRRMRSPERSRMVRRAIPLSPRLRTAPSRTSTSTPRVHSAPRRHSTPAFQSSGSRSSASSRATVRSRSGRGH